MRPRERKELVMKKQVLGERAFTLVELLVVIAIITILIALLLPVVIRVKQQAQQLKCASNLHQLGIAMTAYTAESRFFPVAALTVDNEIAECWPVRLRKLL